MCREVEILLWACFNPVFPMALAAAGNTVIFSKTLHFTLNGPPTPVKTGMNRLYLEKNKHVSQFIISKGQNTRTYH